MADSGSVDARRSAVAIAVQQRDRLIRHGLAQLLDGELDMELTGTAVTPADLVKLSADTSPQVAVIELDRAAEPCRTAATLRNHDPDVRFVGVFAAADDAELPAAVRACFPFRVRRSDGFRAIVDAVRAAQQYPPAPVVLPDEAEAGLALTTRERDVLILVGAGCTTREISDRLAISRKTVENHKQHIFSKLHVRNQAHAVAVAIRAGLITIDGVIDLT
jgi:DNA-binding NarL/FixJ family response regulator